jgi:hypothetical protein
MNPGVEQSGFYFVRGRAGSAEMVLVVAIYLLVGVAIASGWHCVDLHLRPGRDVAVKYAATALAWPFFVTCTIGIALLAKRIDPHRRGHVAGAAMTMHAPPATGEALDA